MNEKNTAIKYSVQNKLFYINQFILFNRRIENINFSS